MLKKLLVVGAAAAALGTVVAAPAYAADPRKDGYGQYQGHGKKGHDKKDRDKGYQSFKYFDDNDHYSYDYDYEDQENETELNQILPLQICQLANVLAVAGGDCTNGPDIDNVEIERD